MDLARLLATARQHLLLFLVCTTLGLAAGGTYAALRDPVYSASSTVLFAVDRGSSVSELAEGTTFARELAPSYAMIVTMPIVLDPVIQRLGLTTTAAKLRGQIAVQMDQGSLIMEIRARDSSAQRAADVAVAVAEQLVRTVPTLSVQAPEQARVSVTTISRGVDVATKTTLSLPVGLALGALLGLVLASALVAVFEIVVSTPLIRDRRTASRVASAPVLGLVPLDPEAKRRPLPVSTHPYLPRAEGYRLLLTNLQLMRSAGEKSLSLVVCAPAKGDGSTSSAVNLAVAFCHTGQRVLLVDADLRNPQVATVLGMRDEEGLSTVLTGVMAWRDVVQTWETQIWGDRRLSVLTAGPAPDNASDLIASQKMRKLLSGACEDFDVVIVDGPDLLTVTDAAALAAQTDGALLVIDARSSRLRQMSEAVNRLRMAGATVVGVALNRVPDEGRALAAIGSAVVGRQPRRILHGNQGRKTPVALGFGRRS
jgi:succinoglycan biosynthesis transport protein ExoP